MSHKISKSTSSPNKTPGSKKGKIDYYFLFAVLALVVIGIVTLASAATIYAQKERGMASYFFYHQLIYGFGLGIFGGFIAFKLPLNFLRRASIFLVLLNIVLMFLIFIPGLGIAAGGASRWLNIGFTAFQPSEFLKLSFILYLAAWLGGLNSKKNDERSSKNAKISLIPFLCILGFVSGLLYIQSDGSTAAVVFSTAVIMYILADTPFLHIFYLGLIGAGGLFILIKFTAYRLARFIVAFESWKDPFVIRDPMGVGFHVKQALIAIGSGGLFGIGIGMSSQKIGQFLPEIMNDSIFVVIAEEGGFISALTVIILFFFIFWRCIHIAEVTKDKFGRFFVIGVGSWFCLQSFVNIGSMLGIVPLAGIPLPLISYGGSHIINELIAIGIVLNISKHNKA